VTIPDGWTPKRVTIVRPRGLGDIVLASAVIDALTRAFPGAALDFIAERPARSLLERDERLDGLFLLGPDSDDPPGGRSRRAIAWLRARKPDLVVDLFSNPRTAVLTAASRARYRVGLDRGVRRIAYNVRIPRFVPSAREDRRWAGEVQLDFLRNAGITWPGTAQASMALTPGDVRFADEAIESLGFAPGARFGAVLPGGSWASKRWTVEGFAAAARELAAGTGQPTLVLWGPPEVDDARAIAEAAGDAARLAPPSTLRGMAALLARPGLLVSPDCLGRHIALVQGTPTLGIFGSTRPSDWTPPTGPHRTLLSSDEGFPALEDLPPEPVLRAIRSCLEEGSLDTSGLAP
jgi:ADP-heptose:LPS heptosyltransferase